jgi:hypothetical protein
VSVVPKQDAHAYLRECPYHRPMTCSRGGTSICEAKACRHHPNTTYPKNAKYGRRR